MNRPAVALRDAVLCPTCDVIYDRHWPCPSCASTTGLDLARILLRRSAVEIMLDAANQDLWRRITEVRS